MFKKSLGIDGLVEYLDHTRELFAMSTKGEETYQLLVDIGRSLAKLPDAYKTEGNRVHGCVSNVYIDSILDDNDRVHYKGSSDSLIIGGYVKILSEALDNLTPSEIQQTEPYIKAFLEKTGLPSSLTPSRANALGSVYKLMKEKAKAYIKD